MGAAPDRVPAGAGRGADVPGAGFRRAAEVLDGLPAGELDRRIGDGTLQALPGIGATTAQVITEAASGAEPAYLTRLLGEAAAGAGRRPARRAARRLPHPLGLVRRRQPAAGDGRGGTRPRSRVDRADRPLAAADRGQRAVRRAAAGTAGADRRAERGARPVPDPDRHRGRHPRGRRRWTRTRTCSDSSTSWSPASTPSCGCPPGPMTDADGDRRAQPARRRARPLHRAAARRPGPAGVGLRRRRGVRRLPRARRAVEINCRPERMDPPDRLLGLAAEMGCVFAIDTDAHAPGQLDWLGNGTARAEEFGVPPDPDNQHPRRRRGDPLAAAPSGRDADPPCGPDAASVQIRVVHWKPGHGSGTARSPRWKKVVRCTCSGWVPWCSGC